MRIRLLASIPLLFGVVKAGVCPSIGGMRLIWQETFPGPAGSSPNRNAWNIALAIDTNNEVQTYTDSSANLQISGGGTVQFVPRRSHSGLWTSGRIETKASFTPQPGRQLMVQVSLRMGGNSNKQGVWPAVWMMGDAVRHGTEWPRCGELDIMEQINGALIAYGTIHCQRPQGGACNEPTGRGATTSIPDNGWHTWSLKWDRTSNFWRTESITWMRDGLPFYVVTGNEIGDEGVWATLAHVPYYVILNVAIVSPSILDSQLLNKTIGPSTNRFTGWIFPWAAQLWNAGWLW
jgi:beta-glucanase (GH16 family)